jgi:LPXTG-motif cell wall-anchored protein
MRGTLPPVPPARVIATLLAALALAAPATAFAQGAGDDQYQDPFGSTTQKSSGSTHGSTTQKSSGSTHGSSGTTTRPSTSSGGLSQTPNMGGSSTSTPTSSATAAGAASGTAQATPQQLPNTGADPRLLALAGLALLLGGIGLRLRTADARL